MFNLRCHCKFLKQVSILYSILLENPKFEDEKISTLRLMKFIEMNAEIKIRLPDVPHLDSQLHEDYYSKKLILESYEENYDKNEYEIVTQF